MGEAEAPAAVSGRVGPDPRGQSPPAAHTRATDTRAQRERLPADEVPDRQSVAGGCKRAEGGRRIRLPLLVRAPRTPQAPGTGGRGREGWGGVTRPETDPETGPGPGVSPPPLCPTLVCPTSETLAGDALRSLHRCPAPRRSRPTVVRSTFPAPLGPALSSPHCRRPTGHPSLLGCPALHARRHRPCIRPGPARPPPAPRPAPPRPRL